MIFVFDTNVFLQMNYSLYGLMDILQSEMNNSPPRFLLALDKDGVIENEYLQKAEEATAAGDYESPVREIWEIIAEGSPLWVKKIRHSLSSSLEQRLIENNCNDPIEPQLFGIAESAGNGTVVCPNEANVAPIRRGYLNGNSLAKIQEEGIGPVVLTLAEALKVVNRPRDYFPENITDLKIYLSEFSFGDKESEERSFLEFKCPQPSLNSPQEAPPCLTKRLLEEAVRAICGFLNTRNGWVLIGVDDTTGSIKPFQPKYIGRNKSTTKRLNVDQLMRDIRAEIDRISPKPGLLVRAWPLLERDTQLCMVCIHIVQGNQSYYYRKKGGSPNNKAKWIRTGFETVPDSN